MQPLPTPTVVSKTATANNCRLNSLRELYTRNSLLSGHMNGCCYPEGKQLLLTSLYASSSLLTELENLLCLCPKCFCCSLWSAVPTLSPLSVSSQFQENCLLLSFCLDPKNNWFFFLRRYNSPNCLLEVISA